MPILLDLQGLSFPAANAAYFQRVAPLVLEIGFGDGGFLTSVAQAHPEWNFIGADTANGSATRAFKRVRREGFIQCSSLSRQRIVSSEEHVL